MGISVLFLFSRTTLMVSLPLYHSSENLPKITKSTEADLCRAAGSQSLEELKQLLRGWSADEIDQANSRKSPVHMAAWKGSLLNLKYLVEDVGCDVEVISKGQYSYGKTPIFFALTQSRADVVDYLLGFGCNVKIVNNKGQTPLSIASSRFGDDVVQRFVQQERDQSSTPWCNYRETHSDGFEYGDLDVRFVPVDQLRTTDHVTAYAVNPTTPQFRRGNFRRRNPKVAFRPKQQQAKPSKREQPTHMISWEAECQLREAWEILENREASAADCSAAVRVVLVVSNQKRCSWIPEAAKRLSSLQVDKILVQEWIKQVKTCCSDVEMKLLQRLEERWISPQQESHEEQDMKTRGRPKQNRIDTFEKWQKAAGCVKHLSLSSLRQGDVLSLPVGPLWIGTKKDVDVLKEILERETLVCFDTEWCNDGSISTLQLAVSDRSWVVDCRNVDESYYQESLRNLVRSIWCDKDKCFLGFSIAHDLVKIRQLVDDKNTATPECQVLDLQQLWICRDTAGCVPGLGACVKSISSVTLDKSCQCSDWESRPLRPEQLDYAGLDAAVLGYLLAEYYRKYGTEEWAKHAN